MNLKNGMQEIPIFFAIDDNYAPFFAVALTSLLDNASKKFFYKIYVLTTSLRKEYADRLRLVVDDLALDNASIDFVSMKDEMEKSTGAFHLRHYYSKETYCRIFIPRVFKQYDKVLYLDTDTLVRSREVAKLFRLPFDSFEVCGVPDVEARQANVGNIVKNSLKPDAKRQMNERLWHSAMPETRVYINAGVTVWNLAKIRENGVEWYAQRLKWLWESICRGEFGFLDQDFINAMMDTCSMLNVKFNKFGGDFGTNCAIQHFVSGTKRHMGDVAKKMGIHA